MGFLSVDNHKIERFFEIFQLSIRKLSTRNFKNSWTTPTYAHFFQKKDYAHIQNEFINVFSTNKRAFLTLFKTTFCGKLSPFLHIVDNFYTKTLPKKGSVFVVRFLFIKTIQATIRSDCYLPTT